MLRMISVAVVEDNAGFRQSLELLLEEAPGFRCVGQEFELPKPSQTIAAAGSVRPERRR